MLGVKIEKSRAGKTVEPVVGPGKMLPAIRGLADEPSPAGPSPSGLDRAPDEKPRTAVSGNKAEGRIELAGIPAFSPISGIEMALFVERTLVIIEKHLVWIHRAYLQVLQAGRVGGRQAFASHRNECFPGIGRDIDPVIFQDIDFVRLGSDDIKARNRSRDDLGETGSPRGTAVEPLGVSQVNRAADRIDLHDAIGKGILYLEPVIAAIDGFPQATSGVR